MRASDNDNETLPAELKALEAELAALVPEDQRLDRSWLLFAAGRASARRGANVAARAWASAFGAMTVVSAALLVVILARPEPPAKIVERIVRLPAVHLVPGTQPRVAETQPGVPGPNGRVPGPDDRVPGPDDGVPGPKRSGGPADQDLANADRRGSAAYASRYPMPEKTSVLAAVFFGVPDEIAGPIRRANDHWRVGDWNLSDDSVPATQPAATRQTAEPPPQPTDIKTYRQLFEELTKTHG